MGWNFERSKCRVQAERQRVESAGISVVPLTRQMDFSNLSPIDARLVTGIHLYADITNWQALLLEPALRRDDYRRLYRTLNITRRELRRITQSVFGGDKIQVQGSRFHALFFRPYNDPSQLASTALRAALAMHEALTSAFGEVFDQYPPLAPAIGLDYGQCLVANIGIRGDRELISIGNAANLAAKMLRGGESHITVGPALYENLSAEDRDFFEPDGGFYRLDCDDLTDVQQLVRAAGWDWSRRSSVSAIQEDKDNFPLSDISVESVRQRIDLNRLGPTTAKSCAAATLFADISGYTKAVEALDGDITELGKAALALHLLRYELRQVVEQDFLGIALQHQGDRLQAIVHGTGESDEEVMQAAVDIGVAINSSVEEIMNNFHPIIGRFHVSIGCSFGQTLIGMLGTKGDRDPVAVGMGVTKAEEIQTALPGRSFGIAKQVLDAIEDEIIAEAFQWDDNLQCYIARDLTLRGLEDISDARALSSCKLAGYSRAGTIVAGAPALAGALPLKVTRPYCG